MGRAKFGGHLERVNTVKEYAEAHKISIRGACLRLGIKQNTYLNSKRALGLVSDIRKHGNPPTKEEMLEIVEKVRSLMRSGKPDAYALAGIQENKYKYFVRRLREKGVTLTPLYSMNLPGRVGVGFLLDDGKDHNPVATVRSESGVPIGWFDSVEEADDLAFDKHWMRVEVVG